MECQVCNSCKITFSLTHVLHTESRASLVLGATQRRARREGGRRPEALLAMKKSACKKANQNGESGGFEKVEEMDFQVKGC